VSRKQLQSSSVQTRDEKRERGDSASIQSVERALDILFLLAEGNGVMTVSEIAARLDVHVSTASRLLSTLASQNVVAQRQDGYRLGLGLLRLTHVVLNELHIRTLAYPHMQQLCQTTQQTIYLATLFEGEELYLDQVEPEDTVTQTNWIGRTIPAHTASGGKVLLAYLSDEQLEQYLQRGLSANTHATITNPDQLRAQLQQVREQGYAISRDEYLVGFSSVAAPIFDRKKQNVGVMVLSGLSANLSLDALVRLSPQVVATANVISLALGYSTKGNSSDDSRPTNPYQLTHH
jgi:DNA-binding IclR family transcriptional regulator